MMDFKMLSKIVNDFWNDKNVDNIRVQFRYDNDVYDVIIRRRGDINVMFPINDEDEREHAIDDVLLMGVEQLVKTRYRFECGPRIANINISHSYINYGDINVVATLGEPNILGREAIVL